MKKLLLKIALATSGILMGAGNAYAVEYLSQEGWSISGCSEELTGETSPNGPLNCLIDGNLSTFYHSAYKNVPSTCTSTGHYHWFVINLGSSQTFYGLDYWRRQGDNSAFNGQAYAGKIYVSNEAFTAFATHADAQAYFENSSNVAAGSFSFDYSTDKNGAKSCFFDKAATGQYVLVIVNNSHGGYLSGAEVKLHATMDPTLAFTQAIAAKKETAEQMLLIADAVGVTSEFPSTEAPSDISDENWQTKANEVNTALTAYISAFDRKQITLQNVRRSNTPYLTAVVMGTSIKFNTEETFTPDAIWAICTVDNGFKLYNRNTGYYIGTDMNPNINNGNAQIFVPASHGENFAIKKVGDSNGLNIDTNGNNLTQYGATDAGSAWIIKSETYSYDTPEASTADAPKYYRIVNARWMYAMASPCLGANGPLLSGGIGENPSRAKATIPGMYWRIEASETEGAVKFINLTGYELAYTAVSQDEHSSSMAENGSDFYLLTQTADQFAGINGSYAICSQSTADTRNCLDASNNNAYVKIDWNPTTEGRGHGDNGSLWYFILATDEEIITATESYYEKYSYLATTFGQDFFEEALGISSLSENTSVASTIRNAKAELGTKVMEKFAENASATYMLKTAQTYANCYMYHGAEDKAMAHADANDLNNFWTFDAHEDGSYKVRNAYTDKCVGIDEENLYAYLPMNDGSSAFTVGYNAEAAGFYFVESNHNTTENYAIHHAGDGDSRIARWNANNGTAASFWHLIPLEECSVDLQFSSASGHVLTFPDMTPNTHTSAGELKITITKRVSDQEVAPMSLEPDADGVYTINATDITEGEVSLSGLSEGIYDVVVPAGMFVNAAGMPTDAYSGSFSVAADGTTTGIDEIAPAVNSNSRPVIYDLQGRRLSAPVKGINIINGKKVLVK